MIREMNSIQLEYLCKNNIITKSAFGGIFQNKNFLCEYDRSKFYIVNTSNDVGIMGHWVLFIFHRGKLFFIDSLGQIPEFYGSNIMKFYRNYMYKEILIKKNIQDPKSLACGAYVFYFSYHITKGKSPKSISRLFSFKRLRYNDKHVENFLYHIAGTKRRCHILSCPYKYFFKNCNRSCCC